MRQGKDELVNALRLRAVEISQHVSSNKTPRGRTVYDRQINTALDEREVARQQGFPDTILRMGSTKWVLLGTPSAHNTLAKALSRLPKKHFGYWTMEYDL